MISASFYNLIKLLGPFGRESYGKTQEVARPVWSTKGLKVVGWKVMGGQKDHLKITFEDDSGHQFSGNYFRQNKVETKAMFYRTNAKEEVFMDVAYRLDVYYKGDPELLILDLKESS